MNTQINVRVSDELLTTAKCYAKKYGYSTMQELIKESLREKVYEETQITKEELALVKRLVTVTKNQKLFGNEDELFKKLRKRK